MTARGGSLQVAFLVVALWIVGVGGVIGALGSLDARGWGGPGLCLVASALAFGLLLSALVRK